MIDERADSDWANLKAVAPFTGAWIEICVDVQLFWRYAVAPFTGAWIEIFTGDAQQAHVGEVSHPSRVRGLKSLFSKRNITIFCCESHPSRVRGLKLDIRWHSFANVSRRTLHGCVD